MMTIAAVIVAGGAGHRAGGAQPKQLALLGGRPVLSWSLDAFSRHERIATVVLVVPAGERAAYGTFEAIADRIVEGGTTRSLSVIAGLKALEGTDASHVMIHDAARPGLDHGTISALADALDEADAVAPALPVVDALKRRSDGRLATIDRGGLYRVQTPQAFALPLIRKALESAPADLVDDLEAVEQLGVSAVFTPGDERLAKITYPEDFAHMSRLLASDAALPRIGTGFDVHAFGPGDHVMLCGVKVPHDRALMGHSDADVAWHALTDAILGALALGDIGDHFPPSDPQWKGASSGLFLQAAMELARARGYRLASCDITLVCERPKIKPHRDDMRARTAGLLHVSPDAVSLKATTSEGLGFTGRGEGIAAQAIAVLSPLP